jgi:hypothetical protein
LQGINLLQSLVLWYPCEFDKKGVRTGTRKWASGDELEELTDPDIFPDRLRKDAIFFITDTMSAPSIMKYIYGKNGINQCLLHYSLIKEKSQTYYL